MKLSVKKIMAQRNIERIKKELAELDAMEAEIRDAPLPQRDETHVIMTSQEKRERLLEELEKYQKIAESEK